MNASKHHHVVHRPLAQIMIDSKDRGFRVYGMQAAVQLLSGIQIMPERLLHNDSSGLSAARFGQLPNHRLEHQRRDGQVKRGHPRAVQRFPDRLES